MKRINISFFCRLLPVIIYGFINIPGDFLAMFLFCFLAVALFTVFLCDDLSMFVLDCFRCIILAMSLCGVLPVFLCNVLSMFLFNVFWLCFDLAFLCFCPICTLSYIYMYMAF